MGERAADRPLGFQFLRRSGSPGDRSRTAARDFLADGFEHDARARRRRVHRRARGGAARIRLRLRDGDHGDDRAVVAHLLVWSPGDFSLRPDAGMVSRRRDRQRERRGRPRSALASHAADGGLGVRPRCAVESLHTVRDDRNPDSGLYPNGPRERPRQRHSSAQPRPSRGAGCRSSPSRGFSFRFWSAARW